MSHKQCVLSSINHLLVLTVVPNIPGTIVAEGTKQNSNTSPKKHIAQARKNLQPANSMAKGAQIADYVLFIAIILVSLQPI